MRLLSLFLVVWAAMAQDWPQFRGNPRLTGVATSAAPKSLKVVWTYEAGEPIESSAAIAGGTVYVGSGAGELLALDLATGKLRWKHKTDGMIGESSPAVAGGNFYFGDLDRYVHAV
jgi:outer membrane protein assembly factor BamB